MDSCALSLAWPPGSKEATCPLSPKAARRDGLGWGCSGPRRGVCGCCPRSGGTGWLPATVLRWPVGPGRRAAGCPCHPQHSRPQQGSLPLRQGGQSRACLGPYWEAAGGDAAECRQGPPSPPHSSQARWLTHKPHGPGQQWGNGGDITPRLTVWAHRTRSLRAGASTHRSPRRPCRTARRALLRASLSRPDTRGPHSVPRWSPGPQAPHGRSAFTALAAAEAKTPL